eukprot:CAMPEP_0181294798 /NCGR_PEP_ID=MMETSP1101-20121128/3800_1 /TAXON_ID=46948 /ORGANISM="Rhodomonas abbreviata, Strain Caron Lab Isolate" /LENGTH=217 /DNA_ID=CAMNT_0023399495 /DNA_START=161 /DNA_END=814 /DNA_ORIENTATION=-
MDYNLGKTRTCLIGNWAEEKSLHEYAGHYRAAPDPGAGTTYKRCIEHSLRLNPEELNPKDPDNHLVYKPDATVGSRQRAIMSRLKTVANEKREPPPPQREWDTIASQSYTEPAVDEHYLQTLGGRVMRTMDNGPVNGRDKTWLLEHGVASAHVCLETAEGAAQLEPLMEQDVPITVYSAQPSEFPMSNPSQSTNPFGKNSAFSLPIGYYLKAPVKDL